MLVYAPNTAGQGSVSQFDVPKFTPGDFVASLFQAAAAEAIPHHPGCAAACDSPGYVHGQFHSRPARASPKRISTAVTAGGDVFSGMALQVLVLTGATESGGASAGNSGGPPATSSITPNGTNSLIPWVATCNGATGFSAAANNTIYSSVNFNAFQAFGYYSGTVTGGSPVTAGATGGSSGGSNGWRIYEVQASGGASFPSTHRHRRLSEAAVPLLPPLRLIRLRAVSWLR